MPSRPVKATSEVRGLLTSVMKRNDEMRDMIVEEGVEKSAIDDFLLRAGGDCTYTKDYVENSAFVIKGAIIEPRTIKWDYKKVRAALKDKPELLRKVVNVSIDAKAMEALIEQGEISPQEVAFCFSLTIGHYVTVSRVKGPSTK